MERIQDSQSRFGTGSTRGAAVSKAALSVSADTIVRTIGWSNKSMFAKFYNKTLLPINSFADAVVE